jgi:hypothetical protein
VADRAQAVDDARGEPMGDEGGLGLGVHARRRDRGLHAEAEVDGVHQALNDRQDDAPPAR